MDKPLFNNLKQVLTTLLTIVALFVGQKAFATEHIVTYYISNYSNSSLTFNRSGDGFSSSTSHTATIANHSFSVDLDDGIRFQASWDRDCEIDAYQSNGAYGIRFFYYSSYDEIGHVPITYSVSCNSYYITHVKMEDPEGISIVAERGSQLTVPGGPINVGAVGQVIVDWDVNLLKSHESYYQMTYQAHKYFCKLIITISDVPRNFPITYNLNGGSATNLNSYTIETSPFTLNNPTKDGCIFTGWTGTDLNGLTETVTIPQYATGSRTYTAHWQALPWEGEGTAEDPFIIPYPSQLDLLATRVKNGTGDDFASTGYSGKYFKLDNDLVYQGTSNNYTPIGTSSNPFKGHFDGNGKTISNIRVTNNNSAVGLFGYVEDGTIENTHVVNSSFTSSVGAGAIVGSITNGTLSHNYYNNCTVNGETTNVGCGSGDITENDGARIVQGLTLADDVTTSPIPVFSFNNTAYFFENTEITFNYGDNIQSDQFVKYYLNGSAIVGNSIAMPASNVTVSFILGQTVDDTWSDDFEGATCGWNLVNNNTGNNWVWGETVNNGGTHALYISNDGGTSYNYSNDEAIVYATKLFRFTQSKFEFSFDWKAHGDGNNNDFLRVALVSVSETLTPGTSCPEGFSSSSLPSGWIALDGGHRLNMVTAWQSKSAIINVPAGDYYLAFAWRNNNSTMLNPPAAVDNVSITHYICDYDITGLAVHNLTTSTATLTWNDCGAQQWEVYYSVNANFESPTTTMVSTPTYTMTGLEPGTVYFTKVRPVCDGPYYGAWSEVISFHSECEALTNYPYEENFDSYAGSTSGTTNNLPGCWHYNNATTSSSNRGYPIIYNSSGSLSNSDKSHSGNKHLRFYYSYSSIYSNDPQNQYAILPPMENLDDKQISFYAKTYYANSPIKVGMMTDPTDITTFVEIASFTPSANAYTEYLFLLSGTGNYVAIMMEAANATTSRGVLIDDITIEPASSCLKPTALVASNPRAHNVTLNWTVNDATQTTWEVQVATNEDFSENVVLLQNINVHVNYLLTDLNPDTHYYVRVRANCGGVDGVSPWSTPTDFTTTIPCPAPTSITVTDIQGHSAKLNWTGTSDNYFVKYRTAAHSTDFFEPFYTNSVPSGWIRTQYSFDDVQFDDIDFPLEDYPSSGWTTSTNALGAYNMKANLYSSSSIHNQIWLITPEVTVNNSNCCLNFTVALTEAGSDNPVDPTSPDHDRFIVLLYSNGHWFDLHSWYTSDLINSATGQDISISLQYYVGRTVRIAFYGEYYYPYSQPQTNHDLHIDNVGIGVPIPAGEWQTVTVDESPAVLTGLTPETYYDAKVQGNCGDVDGLSLEVSRDFKTTALTTITKDIAGYPDDDSGWHLIASPMTGSTAVTDVTNLTSNTYDLYRFNQSAESEWQNYKVHNSDAENPFNALVSGQGYLYANSGDANNNPNTVTLSFTGDPVLGNTCDVNLVKDSEAGWNLVGNPFNATTTVNKDFYHMNPAGSEIVVATENTVDPMEGIFVHADDNGDVVTFTKASRNANDNSGKDASMVVNLLGKNLGSVIDCAIIRFGEGQALPKFQIRNNSTKLYIPQSGKDYAIAFSDKQSEMPLNFKAAKNGEYTITVAPEGVEMDYLHLIDNMTGADINLLETADYTFTAKTTDYESRFRMVFSTNDEDGASTGSAAFAFVSNGEIVITGLDGDACNASLQVIDVLGHVYRDAMLASPNQRISTSGMPAGLYILRLIDGETVRTQKIVIG